MLELTGLVLAGVGLLDVGVEPHVCDGHPVLRQCARLVRADRRRRAQSLHRLEVLHQTVLARHALRRQRQTHLHTDAQAPHLGKGKGKVFPYSLPSVGPGADPGVQAVSPQVT